VEKAFAFRQTWLDELSEAFGKKVTFVDNFGDLYEIYEKCIVSSHEQAIRKSGGDYHQINREKWVKTQVREFGSKISHNMGEFIHICKSQVKQSEFKQKTFQAEIYSNQIGIKTTLSRDESDGSYALEDGILWMLVWANPRMETDGLDLYWFGNIIGSCCHQYKTWHNYWITQLFGKRKPGEIFSAAVVDLLPDHLKDISEKKSEKSRKACAEEFGEEILEDEQDQKVYSECFLERWDFRNPDPLIDLEYGFLFGRYKAKLELFCTPFPEAEQVTRVIFSGTAYVHVEKHLKAMKIKKTEKSRKACADEFYDDTLAPFHHDQIIFGEHFLSFDFKDFDFNAYEKKFEEFDPHNFIEKM